MGSFEDIIKGITQKPFYQDSSTVIYCADNRDILQNLGDGITDLVCDPPYGLNEVKNNASRGKLAVSKNYGLGEWDVLPADDDLIKLCRDKTKSQIIFGGNYFNLPPSKCWLVWDKDNAGNDFADCELAWTNLDMAVRKFLYRWNGMLQEDMKNKETRYHPTQKPVALMRWCISFLKNGLPVIDPFMGAGSTLLAAKSLGLKSIGIEKEEQYAEISAKRLSQTVMNLEIPQENIKQESMEL